MKKLISLILIFSFIALCCIGNISLATNNEVQEINFKDSNLQKAFLEIVGKSENETLTMQDIKNSVKDKYISLSFKNITDLTGIDVVLNSLQIEGIDICNNTISDISPLSKVKTIKSLWIKDNKIQDISSLKNLSQLSDLRAEGNNINTISSLANLKNLKTLYLDNNNISDISILSNFTNLEVLSMPNNKIKNIDSIINLKKLSYVNFENNQIRNIGGFPSNTIINSSDDVGSYTGWGHIVILKGNYIDFEKPYNKSIKEDFDKANWVNNFENQDGDVFEYNPQNKNVTPYLRIFDKNNNSKDLSGIDEHLYCEIEVSTSLDYNGGYYELYFDDYVGKTITVDGLGTFTFDKQSKVENYGEPYIYKCKITNPEKFYKAGTNSYKCTYTIENTKQTYTTTLEIKISGLEVKAYEGSTSNNKQEQEQEKQQEQNKQHILDNEPKTGYNTYTKTIIGLLFMALSGILIIRKYNK